MSAIPHGNCGKMASPIPCVAGKHFLRFLCFTYVSRKCQSLVERTIVRSNSLLKDARIHFQPLLHDVLDSAPFFTINVLDMCLVASNNLVVFMMNNDVQTNVDIIMLTNFKCAIRYTKSRNTIF